MGSAQSKPSEAVINEKLVERLTALQVKGKTRQQELEQEYIYIDEENPPLYTTKGSETVSISTTEQWEKELLEDPKNRLAISALTSNPLTSIISQKSKTLSDIQTFNIHIPFEGSPVTNQRSSGRCWLFAATNVFRVAVMKKHNLKEFELSQAYLFFWDKLEKANWFLEQVVDTISESLDSRIVQELLSSPVGDGGQWDMVANLVEKYGLVPQSLYPDSYNAMNSSAMGSLITTKLREDALKLRDFATFKRHATKESLAELKAKMLQEVHLILTLMLGPPPSPTDEFTWEYNDANDKYHKVVKTPLQFSKEFSDKDTVRACGGADVHKLFSLVNDPRNTYGELLSVERLGNVIGGRPITYVNVDMTTIKNATIAMLRAGLPVFFGSDVGKFSNSSSGIMDTALYDYNLGFNIRLNMSKASRLMTRDSAMTHAMVLTAVQVEDDKPVRWRVMNSWGEDAGKKGYFVMSDAWMNQFVYQVVVDPRFVKKEVRDVLGKKARMLPLWDPMGALA